VITHTLLFCDISQIMINRRVSKQWQAMSLETLERIVLQGTIIHRFRIDMSGDYVEVVFGNGFKQGNALVFAPQPNLITYNHDQDCPGFDSKKIELHPDSKYHSLSFCGGRLGEQIDAIECDDGVSKHSIRCHQNKQCILDYVANHTIGYWNKKVAFVRLAISLSKIFTNLSPGEPIHSVPPLKESNLYPAAQIKHLIDAVPGAKESECLEMIVSGKQNIEEKLAKRTARWNTFIDNVRGLLVTHGLETTTNIEACELYDKYRLSQYNNEESFMEQVIQPVITEREEQQRTQELSQYLKQQGLEFRTDSEMCRRWVKNATIKTMEQIGWIMRDAKHLYTKTDYPERIGKEIEKRKRLSSDDRELFFIVKKRCKLEALSAMDDSFSKRLAQRVKHNDEWYDFENETYSSSEYEYESDSDDE